MPRCDYDVVFYRVFCVTLLVIAFTFTIILTNVFIDIDGLLAKKEAKHKNADQPEVDAIHEQITPEPVYSDDASYGEADESFRTKRSIETQNLLFHIKNPKIKNILTNRLETLLEALDAEEHSQNTKKNKDTQNEEVKNIPIDELVVADDSKLEEEKMKRQKDEDMLHLTIHNILLQGIIGHMDLNQVFKRVNTFMKNLNKDNTDQKENDKSEEKSIRTQSEEIKPVAIPSLNERLVGELMKCNNLQENILSNAEKKVVRKNSGDTGRSGFNDPTDFSKQGLEEEATDSITTTQNTPKTSTNIAINKIEPSLLIKTTVDIKSMVNDLNETISNKGVQGILEVIYNGKSVKITKPNIDEPVLENKTTFNMIKPKLTTSTTEKFPPVSAQPSNLVDIQALRKIPKDYFNKFISEYFKHFSPEHKDLPEEVKEGIESKRSKRHVKIKFDKEKKGTHTWRQEKPNTKKSSEDDELYVEIETRFDSKGMKGEKKKKLIRSLIDKIQKAIYSEEKKKVEHESKPLHVKKRIQNPLEHADVQPALLHKYMVHESNIVHRQLNPIIVTQNLPHEDNNTPNVKDRSGEAWKKQVVGPAFLAATKSINSAEMSEVEVDYNRELGMNGIPQRLQKPLNTNKIDEMEKNNSYFDLGDMKFLIKDVDGSGFSIGFNQYVDEPPDPETIKLFTGLENVIRTYHQDVDQTQDGPHDIDIDPQENQDTTPTKNDHIIVRRSVNHERDYHSNEYKIIFDSNFLPYNDYKDIYDRENSNTNLEFNTNQNRNTPLIVDEHIFEKKLKPSEIFGLANLLQRKKRSLRVRKISNLNSKIKLSRYLNTKSVSTKRILLNKKRHKRQISKIRIIASDIPYKHSSDANVFLVSGENLFADRAIVKDVEASEAESEKTEESEYSPYQPYETQSIYKEFESRSRKNNLMSKYPHIFMEEISKSKEDFSPRHALLFNKLPTYRRHDLRHDTESENVDDEFMGDTSSTIRPEFGTSTEPIEKVEGVRDILEAIQQQAPKANYRVSVRVTPKNTTSLHPGFKEVHTSINKVYNKNGLRYTSLVNVSEISNITHLNKSESIKSDFNKIAESHLADRYRNQHQRMQILLKKHEKLINDQLLKLIEEKSNIESILNSDNSTTVPHFDYANLPLASKLSKVLVGNEFNKIESLILNTRKNAVAINEVTTEKEITITTMKPTTTTQTAATTTTLLTTTESLIPISVTTVLPQTSSMYTEKMNKNLLHSIERNEKLTDQILRKVDKNTEILEKFLNKLSNSIESHKTDARLAREERMEPFAKYDHIHQFPVDWRQHGIIPFNPNLMRKNSTQIPIPFVYAYQHPMMPLKLNSPVASVVYHGAIHTNPIHPKEIPEEKDKKQNTLLLAKNQTRFFMDDVESDYKVIPMTNLKKHKMNKNATMT